MTKHRLVAIEDAVDDAIVAESRDGVVTSWNRAACELLGYTAAEIVGRPIALLLTPERIDDERARRERVLAGARERITTQLVRKDGVAIEVAVTVAPVRDDAGEIAGCVTIVRDLSSLGTVAASVAHEINNPLAYISANLDMLEQELRELHGGKGWNEIVGLVQQAREGAERIRKVVRDLVGPRRQPGRSTPRPAPPTSAKRGRVLVVDDEVVFASSLRRFLARDHEVTVVHSGREAIERIAAGLEVDVILCDLMMPDLTGMDVHRFLTEQRPDLADRTIFLTGGAVSQDAQDFLARLGNRWYEKPCDLQELRTAVRKFVG